MTRAIRVKLAALAVLTIFTGTFMLFTAIEWHPATTQQHIHSAVLHGNRLARVRNA